MPKVTITIEDAQENVNVNFNWVGYPDVEDIMARNLTDTQQIGCALMYLAKHDMLSELASLIEKDKK